MTFNLNEYKDDILFLPLGGSDEIGMNVNLYYYKGKWLIVDLGAGFADDSMPGADMMVADLSFIQEHKNDIAGLVLTHAHEDHLGAVQYLWDELGCPVFTTQFTANFLRLKLKESGLDSEVKITEVNSGDRFNAGPFDIEMVPLTHSAPEMHGIVLRTDKGNILHTGDWKFDHNPLIGEAWDEELLRSYGKEGIMALVCDSTNVFNSGWSGSEGDLRVSLVNVIKECKKMAVVSTFASNLARIDTILHAAKEAGRKVVVTGKSMWRIIEAAQASGYLEDIDDFVDERDIGRYKRENILIMATGCQGERLAAVTKMANNKHPNIKLAPDDTVIFSSKIIPGNDKKIYALFNQLVKSKVNIVTEKDRFVHVSGHPSVDELKKMYELVRPDISVPVHGEGFHIFEHAKLARSLGVKTALQPENGSVIRLTGEKPQIVSKVNSGYLAVDGYYLLDSRSEVLSMRRKMRDDGIIFITMAINSKYKLKGVPVLSCPGVLSDTEDAELIKFIKQEIASSVQDFDSSRGKNKQERFCNAVRGAVRAILKSEIGKSPTIDLNLLKV